MVIDSRYILKLEPTVFVDGLDIGYKEKKESQWRGERGGMDKQTCQDASETSKQRCVGIG